MQAVVRRVPTVLRTTSREPSPSWETNIDQHIVKKWKRNGKEMEKEKEKDKKDVKNKDA
jgi:hypothetical protein